MKKLIKIEEIKLKLQEEETILENKIIDILWIKKQDLIEFKISKKAIDSRNKKDILFVYSVLVLIKNQDNYFLNLEKKSLKIINNIKKHKIKQEEEFVYEIQKTTKKPTNNPVIIWSWPAWLFCALILAEAGLNPIIIERWKDVENRIKDVENFSNWWKLNQQSNIQFWEWWAWTFSDWKLYTLINDKRSNYVFDELVKAWAPKEITYDAKPHIGTDKLRILVKKLREKIISLWWQFRFETCLTSIEIRDSKLKSITLNNSEIIQTQDLILAIWHSARDTIKMLYESWLEMQAKSFAIWVRIEHDSKLINKSQYGDFYDNKKLWTAKYKLVSHSKEERSVYTFCMCPWGYVVAASSEEGKLCINWMSEYAQNSWVSNSALLVPVSPEDFPSNHPLSWIEFQRNLEQKAFKLWWENYFAPAQLVWDFLENKESKKLGKLVPTYKPWIKLTSLDKCLPEFVTKSLRLALLDLDKKIKWFATSDAILTAVEARSSSSVKIIRNENFESNISWIYPTWEWAWYAWWITSSAIDWLKVAEAIIEKYS